MIVGRTLLKKSLWKRSLLLFIFLVVAKLKAEAAFIETEADLDRETKVCVCVCVCCQVVLSVIMFGAVKLEKVSLDQEKAKIFSFNLQTPTRTKLVMVMPIPIWPSLRKNNYNKWEMLLEIFLRAMIESKRLVQGDENRVSLHRVSLHSGTT